MAEKNEQGETLLVTDTVLVAYVTVHLEDDTSFELLPFEDTRDVKSRVGDLVRDWAQSGFLVRGSRIIPWHRVQRLEATKVEELKLEDAQLRREQWQARQTEQLQQSFWQTKQPREKKGEGDEKAGGNRPGA